MSIGFCWVMLNSNSCLVPSFILREVVKSSAVIVDFSILLSVASHILQFCCPVCIHLGLLCLLGDLSFYHYVMFLSVIGNFLCSEFYFMTFFFEVHEIEMKYTDNIATFLSLLCLNKAFLPFF